MKTKVKFAISVILIIIFVFIIYIAFYLLGTPKRISVDDFIKLIECNRNAVIYYGQESCSACKAIYPKIKTISREIGIKIYYLDAETVEDDDVLQQYNIFYTPEIIIINSGEVQVYDDINIDNLKNILSTNDTTTTKERPKNLYQVNYDEVLNKMDSNVDFILYIGREDCRDCQKFHPVVSNYVGKDSTNGIYYFDIKEYRDKTLVDNPSLNDTMFYDELIKLFDVEWVPCVYHIRNGAIIDKFEYLSLEYYELDENERIEAEEKYNKEFYIWMETCN